ncbi:MAG TPA: hypothetical protein VMM92_06065, partial [Thermoanaerobaculia bacterium]|nr:hypothetical protein [Thermoanaerobaculia bacterium]
GSYKSRNGQVSTGAAFVAREPLEIGQVALRIPYAELHVAPNAHSDLEYRVLIFDRDSIEGQRVLYSSGPRHFSVN